METKLNFRLKLKDAREGSLRITVSYGDQHSKSKGIIEKNLYDYIGFQLNIMSSKHNYKLCDFVALKKRPDLINHVAFEPKIEYIGENFEGLKEVSDAIRELLVASAHENEYVYWIFGGALHVPPFWYKKFYV